MNDITDAVAYIEQHPEINNVLLSGGDPLIMSTGKQLNDHQTTARHQPRAHHPHRYEDDGLHPYRILNDPSLLEMVSEYSLPDRKDLCDGPFQSPRELTEPALKGLQLLQKAGAITVNQSPLIQGVNDKPEIIAKGLAAVHNLRRALLPLPLPSLFSGNRSLT